VHLRLWSSAVRLVLPQGRYAVLLVSLHGTGLYERYNTTKDTPETVRAVQEYLAQEHAFQEEVLANLRDDPHYAPYAVEKAVARNQRLVQVWDALSLAMCFGNWRTRSVQQVPTATQVTTLTLTASDGDPMQLIIAPWPFRREQVTLVYEGRFLAETFSSEAVMREALKRAPWVTLQTILLPDQT
jgi:hypothetical protein